MKIRTRILTMKKEHPSKECSFFFQSTIYSLAISAILTTYMLHDVIWLAATSWKKPISGFEFSTFSKTILSIARRILLILSMRKKKSLLAFIFFPSVMMFLIVVEQRFLVMFLYNLQALNTSFCVLRFLLSFAICWTQEISMSTN